jgi:hypothetical protein
MSPILTRPVREQLEHDRIIRLIQGRYKRKFEVAINPGTEQHTSVTAGELVLYPDLVLFSQEKGRRLMGTIEVETGESVNTLEALAQWGPFSRLKAPFYLYVPPNALDTARRLCAEHNVAVAEIWTYHPALDQIRFTMVHRAPEPPAKVKPTRAESGARAAKSEKADKPGPSKRRTEKRAAAARAGKSTKGSPRRVQPPARANARGAAKATPRKARAVTKRR